MRAILLLILALFSAPAFATLSVTTGQSLGGNPPGTCSISASVGSGQAVVVMTEGTAPGTLTITDSVNSGNYSLISLYSGEAMGVFWMKTNNTGSPPVITVSGTTGYTYVWCFAVTGFVGTPTVDTGIASTNSGSDKFPTINATSNFNSEIMLVHAGKTYTEAITVTGWSKGATGSLNAESAFYAIEVTAGTANNFDGSISTSQTWYLMLAGIYDASSAQGAASMFLGQ